MSYRTYRQIAEMDAIRRSDTLRQMPTRMPTQEFLEMSKHRSFPTRIAIVLFGAVIVPVIVMVLEFFR